MELLKKILLALLAVLLIIEEWLWEILTQLGRWLSRVLRLARVEEWLAASPPYIALVAFVIPLLIVTPLNLLAFWLLAKGAIVRGICLEILAKLLGMLLVARVFALTRTQLLSFRWIAYGYTTITGWLRWAHERVAATALYKAAKALKLRIKAMFRKP